jgi:HD-GYP domain-containing protein (c-di-GMP phosphodiesterase class II)
MRSLNLQPLNITSIQPPQADNASLGASAQSAPELMFIVDRNGRILDSIAGDSTLLKSRAENLVGRRAQQVLPAEAAVAVAEALQRVSDGRARADVEYVQETTTGIRRLNAQCLRLDEDRLLVMVREINSAHNPATVYTQPSIIPVSLQELAEDSRLSILAGQITESCATQFGGARRVWMGLLQDSASVEWVGAWPDEGQLAEFAPSHVESVLQEKKEVVLENCNERQASSCGLFPLITEENVVALLGVASDQPGFFSDELTIQLRKYCHLAASSLSYALLYAEAERRLEQMQVVREIDLAILSTLNLRETAGVILEKIVQQFNVDAADILILDSTTDHLHYVKGIGFHAHTTIQSHLGLEQSYAGLAVRERRLVHIENLRHSPLNLMTACNFKKEAFQVYLGTPLIARGEVKGVLEIYQRHPLKVTPDWYNMLEMIANQFAIAIDNSLLLESLDRRNTEITSAYNATIEGLSRALELRDRETEGHTRRVAELTLLLADKIDISQEQRIHMERGALLHDVGKMGIPDDILRKPGKLTSQEWEIMKHHPLYAYNILSQIDYLKPALDIPLYHHEHWDGSGYPYGLAGEHIPLAARIFAVVDVYDALTSDRPYRTAWSKGQALDYMNSQSGQYFDPLILQTFMGMSSDL